MIRAGFLEKLLEVISRLSHLVLSVTLGGSNELIIRIVVLLVALTLIAASSNYDPLGSTLWPPLVAFSTPLCAFAGCFGWCPLATARDHLPIILDENSHDYLLT
jgi:hypothetical protein